MFEIDEISHLVTLDTQYRLSELEKLLARRDYTLGYFIPPNNEMKLEEALSRKIPNLYSWGNWEDLCVALELHSKDGENLKSFLAPRQAAGPDWKNFILGTGSELGLISKATLKVFERPSHFLYAVVGLAHDIASHLLEQELLRVELQPWAFARLGILQVPRGFRLPKSPLILLAAWAGTRSYVDACRRALEAKLENRYAWKYLETKSLQKQAHQLLHAKYPIPRWGGR